MMSIETERLVIRNFDLDDTKKVFQMSQEKLMKDFLPDQVYENLEHTKEIIDFLMSKYEEISIVKGLPYVLGIELKATGELIGHVGLSLIDKGVEIGYAIEADHHGKNYATEAVKAMTTLGLNDELINEIWAVIDFKNIASMRVLEKSGYKYVEKDLTKIIMKKKPLGKI